MIGVAQHAGSRPVGGDVPGVEFRNGPDFARGPIHSAQQVRPDGENDIAGTAEKCLVNDELIIAVLMQALHPRPIPPDAEHAGRRIACEQNPIRIDRVKLRMDHRAREGNHVPAGPIRAPGRNAVAAALLDGRRQPLPVRAQRAFA
jgi:hypothetical protein